MAVQRGTAPSKPHAITLQGHPEFSTPTGARFWPTSCGTSMARSLARAGLRSGCPLWMMRQPQSERIASHAAAMRLLWP